MRLTVSHLIRRSSATLIVFLLLQSLSAKAEETKSVDPAELLSHAQSAVQWSNWCSTTTEIRFISSTKGPPPDGSGFEGTVTCYRAEDGREHVKLEQRTKIDKSGKFVKSRLHQEQIFADGRFLMFHCGEDSPPGPRNGIVRIWTKNGGADTGKAWCEGVDAIGGFLDGKFASHFARNRSIIALAKEGKLTKPLSNENINGIDCIAGEWETPAGTVHIWISPSQQYNIIKFDFTESPPASAKKSPSFVPMSIHVQISELEKVGDRVVVMGGKCESVSFDDVHKQTWKTVTTAKRTSVSFNPLFKDPALFKPESIPDGIRVMFADADPPQRIMYVWSNGKPKPAFELLPELPAAAPFIDMKLDDAKTKAQKENKVVFVDFYTSWCGPCKLLDKTTLSDEKVRKFLADKTIPLHINAEKQTALADKFKVESYPTMLFLRADGSEIGRLSAYCDAPTFLDDTAKILAKK